MLHVCVTYKMRSNYAQITILSSDTDGERVTHFKFYLRSCQKILQFMIIKCTYFYYMLKILRLLNTRSCRKLQIKVNFVFETILNQKYSTVQL